MSRMGPPGRAGSNTRATRSWSGQLTGRLDWVGLGRADRVSSGAQSSATTLSDAAACNPHRRPTTGTTALGRVRPLASPGEVDSPQLTLAKVLAKVLASWSGAQNNVRGWEFGLVEARAFLRSPAATRALHLLNVRQIKGMNRILLRIIALATSTLLLCACRQQPAVSHDELVQLLGIRKWVVPAPRDQRFQWAFEVRDGEIIPTRNNGDDSWMDRARTATVIFMPVGDGNVYRFWFLQSTGTSSGLARVDVCENPYDVNSPCDAGQVETCWFDEPRRAADGKTYVIGEVRETLGLRRHKQIVLCLTGIRPEDMGAAAK